MKPSYKKIIIITIAVIVLAAGFVAGWLVWKSRKNNIAPTKTYAVTKILDKEIIFPSFAAKENQFYYVDKKENYITTYNPQINKEQKLFKLPDSPYRVVWSPDNQQAIIKVPFDKEKFTEGMNNSALKENVVNGEITNWLWDKKQDKLIYISKYIRNVAWSPDNKKIIYQYYVWKKNQNNITIANPDGTGWQEIINLDGEEFGVSWLDIENILLYYLPTDPSSGSNLYKINIKNKEKRELIGDFSILDIKISPDGKKILYEIYENSENNSLGLINQDGSDKKRLSLQTSMGKTTWSLESNNFLAALTTEDNKSDTLYRVEANGDKKEVLNYKFDEIIKIENLMVDNNNIYFTSKDFLYKLEL